MQRSDHASHSTIEEIERKAALSVLALVSIAWSVGLVVLAATVRWPDLTVKLPVVGALVLNSTTWALLAGLGGIVVALLLIRSGVRVIGVITTAIALIATVVVAAPIVGLWQVAAEHGASISLLENLRFQTNEGAPVPARSVTYATVDGRDLQLDVWVPGSTTSAPPAASGTLRPAVLWVHGGGWVSGTRGQTPQWNEWLNEQGYAVFDIDYRLPAVWNQTAGDLNCAVGWVKAHAAEYGVDPNRVALAGGSAGAQLVLQATYGTGGAPTPSSCPTGDTSVRAAVALYPATEFVSLWEADTTDGLMQLWIGSYQGGAPSAVPDHYRASSPVDNVRAGVPPSLLVHGLEDRIIPVEQSERMPDPLARVGAPIEVVTLPLMDHAFDHAWGSLGTQIARQVVVRFLAEHMR